MASTWLGLRLDQRGEPIVDAQTRRARRAAPTGVPMPERAERVAALVVRDPPRSLLPEMPVARELRALAILAS